LQLSFSSCPKKLNNNKKNKELGYNWASFVVKGFGFFSPIVAKFPLAPREVQQQQKEELGLVFFFFENGVELGSGSIFRARPKLDYFFSFYWPIHHRPRIWAHGSIQAQVFLGSNPRLNSNFFKDKNLKIKKKVEFQVFTSNLLLSSWGVLRSPMVFEPSPSSYTKKSTRMTLRMSTYIHVWN
jgi:hypothetical protein